MTFINTFGSSRISKKCIGRYEFMFKGVSNVISYSNTPSLTQGKNQPHSK